ncbi:MAG: SAM-dependent methyltransferase [Flavobacteriales bacterium]
MTSKGCLFLVPTTLGDSGLDLVLPTQVQEKIKPLRFFIAEHSKQARAFFNLVNLDHPQSDLNITELNKHTDRKALLEFLQPIFDGNDMALLSDAGCPGIADPGADVIALAHQHQIEIYPFVGPSSILLAHMASGMNGQSFAFNGYLPIDASAKKQAIKQFEKRAQSGQSQSFIETPYRNKQLFSDLIKACQNQTKLCVAFQLTLPDQSIKTKTIAEWKKTATPDFHKKPCVFVLGS